MRVKKFDQRDIAALRKLGFDIAEDGETAKISGVMTSRLFGPKLSLNLSM